MAAFYARYVSPVGLLVPVVGADGSVLRIDFGDGALTSEEEYLELTKPVIDQLKEYFNGDRELFSVPLTPQGTPFQKQVWRVVAAVPYGETQSYGQIAERLGDRNLSRAVGAANGANPIPIIVPCHRIIGSSGRLTGYAGGLELKAKLLDLEQKTLF